MRFVVDAMFGRLARWLRMSGYDTIYDTELKDGRMIGIAREEGRVLITRDRDVHARAVREGVRALFLRSGDFLHQLRQLEEELGIAFRDTPELARCPVCNGELEWADKKDIRAKLPEKVVERYDEFWACRDCGKVYWQGGHWSNIQETLRRLREDDRRGVG